MVTVLRPPIIEASPAKPGTNRKSVFPATKFFTVVAHSVGAAGLCTALE